jgi:hypothetical protein
MRILRGLSSRFLPCGCLVGIYETYDAKTVAVVDAESDSCVNPAHRDGNIIPVDQDASTIATPHTPSTGKPRD